MMFYIYKKYHFKVLNLNNNKYNYYNNNFINNKMD